MLLPSRPDGSLLKCLQSGNTCCYVGFAVFDLSQIFRGLPNKVSVKFVFITGQDCQKFSWLKNNNPGGMGQKLVPEGPITEHK